MARKQQADDKPKSIEFRTPAMEAYVGVGYGGMTLAKAELIIKERKEKPDSWPYEMLEKAQGFIEAYNGKKMF